MIKPTNLPAELVPLKDAVIDYIYGRLQSFPPNLKPLLDWLSLDDCLLGFDAKEGLGLDIYRLSQLCFDDDELASWEGVEEDEITDEMRINFARERMRTAFEDDESSVISLQGALISNEQGEEAYICAFFESHGQGGMEITDWAYVKTYEDFLESIRKAGSLVLLDEIEEFSDSNILNLWKINGILPNTPDNLPQELISVRDKVIDYANGRSNSEPEDVEALYNWFEFEGHDNLHYVDWVNDYSRVAGNFYDDELSATLDVDINQITNEMRLSFAREYLAREFNDEGEITVVEAVISNEKREKAILGMLMRESSMADSGFTHWGIYKSTEDLLKAIEDDDSFISIDDHEKLTDEFILESWGKY